jgi:hypothetical protein
MRKIFPFFKARGLSKNIQIIFLIRCSKFQIMQATFKEARKKCCSYGTNLLSIKTAAKRRCLSGLAVNYPDIEGDYWTSGSDVGCDGNFKWCSVDRAFLKKEVQWGKGQPNLQRGDCVYTQLRSPGKNSSSLFTEDCSRKKKFICEVGVSKRASKRNFC